MPSISKSRLQSKAFGKMGEFLEKGALSIVEQFKGANDGCLWMLETFDV